LEVTWISCDNVTEDEHSMYPLTVKGPVRVTDCFEVMDLTSFRGCEDIGVGISGSLKSVKGSEGFTDESEGGDVGYDVSE
jgi:hypothetical protein